MQVQIIFTASGSSTATGNFAPGDTLRCSDEMARHFVEEACCAKYSDAAHAPAAPVAPVQPAAKRARRASGA